MEQLLPFIMNEINCDLYTPNRKLERQIKECWDTYKTIQPLLLFDELTLKLYNVLLHAIYDYAVIVIPKDNDLKLTKKIKFEVFVDQLTELDLTEIQVLLYYMFEYKMIKLDDDVDFKFIISAMKTLQVFNN